MYYTIAPLCWTGSKALELTYAILTQASFVVQHRAVLLRSKPSVKVRTVLKSGSTTSVFWSFLRFLSQFLRKLGKQVSKGYPGYEQDNVISFLLGLLSVMCMPVFVVFFCCVYGSCVGVCALWCIICCCLSSTFVLSRACFFLCFLFDSFCLPAMYCLSTVTCYVLLPSWSCPSWPSCTCFLMTQNWMDYSIFGGRSRLNIIGLIPLQLAHLWAHEFWNDRDCLGRCARAISFADCLAFQLTANWFNLAASSFDTAAA